jgi:hypothetical protein
MRRWAQLGSHTNTYSVDLHHLTLEFSPTKNKRGFFPWTKGSNDMLETAEVQVPVT